MKLSEVQRRTLLRMASGDEIWTTGGGDNCAFWHGHIGDRRPSFATIHALWNRGLITNCKEGVRSGAEYRISPTGRRALDEP